VLKVVWLAAAAFACSGAGNQNSVDYSIAAIDYLPTPLEQVGTVKAGLLCLPKGKLRWRDVARPEDEVLRRRLIDVVGKNGILVAPPANTLFGDPEPATTYRIRVVVADAKLKLCVAGDVLLLGKVGRAPHTVGTITVRWETYDRVARQMTDTVSYDIPVDDAAADARTASHVISDALVESARRYAVRRST
jgi:hypothetical protein